MEVKELVDNPYYNNADNICATQKTDSKNYNVNDAIENITVLQTTLNPYYCPLENDVLKNDKIWKKSVEELEWMCI